MTKVINNKDDFFSLLEDKYKDNQYLDIMKEIVSFLWKNHSLPKNVISYVLSKFDRKKVDEAITILLNDKFLSNDNVGLNRSIKINLAGQIHTKNNLTEKDIYKEDSNKILPYCNLY